MCGIHTLRSYFENNDFTKLFNKPIEIIKRDFRKEREHCKVFNYDRFIKPQYSL